jgi:glyoxylase-like metal-dependent hydrolase (beta-lactamase superfamily II)
MRSCLLATALLTASCASAEPASPAFHLIPGAVPLDKGPDGNSVILDAPVGLIVVDTGRHPEHSARILAFARERRRAIAAVVNTHWHLDHTTGNWDIRETYPEVQVLASDALEGALATYLKKSSEQTDAMLADAKTSTMQRDHRSGERSHRPAG